MRARCREMPGDQMGESRAISFTVGNSIGCSPEKLRSSRKTLENALLAFLPFLILSAFYEYLLAPDLFFFSSPRLLHYDGVKNILSEVSLS